MMKRTLAFAAALLGSASLAVIAWAQATPPISSQIFTDDLIQDIPHGAAAAGNRYIYPKQITTQYGYYKSAPATGFTYTFAANVSKAAFRPSTTLATGTITMPASPNDGQQVCMFSTQIVSTLTVSANTGQSINNNATAFTALGHLCYLYSLSNATWDRTE
jgi:hypothetical protein